jgi:hypothetical protein
MADFAYGRNSMKFPGYWVSAIAEGLWLEKTTFDETELDPATNWKQAWQNQDGEGQVKGHVDLHEALISAATLLARQAGRPLSRSDLDGVIHFAPVWQANRCKIQSLSHLFGSNIS